LRIVTKQFIPTQTHRILTAVILSAQITIVAWQNIGIKLTTALWLARIVGADVLVITDNRSAGDTDSIQAVITACTRIQIITVSFIRDKDTSHSRTGIICTRITVITIRRRSGNALAILAGIVDGAWITILTGCKVIGKDTPGIRFTDIIGA
jgi:hypothetical protein